MTWTKYQMQDHIIDQIIKIIIKNKYDSSGYFNNAIFQLNLSDFRKTISDSGYIQTGTTNNKKNVIYQEDYQKLSTEVDTFIDQHLSCFDTGNVNSNLFCPVSVGLIFNRLISKEDKSTVTSFK